MTATLSLIFRIILGGIFLLAGLAKIPDPASFLLTMRGFSIFPDLLERFFAVFIPWLELILGLCLLTGLLYRAAALLFALLISGFTFAILSVMARGFEIDCGCFGLLADYLHLPDAADHKAVIRNVVFLAMAHFIFYSKKTRFSLDEHLRQRTAKGARTA
jgi:uncharacterized membrane protein YphA (DoxX/SURF4 family)